MAAKRAKASAKRKARKEIKAATAYVRRCFRQLALFTKAELDAAAAAVADRYHANQRDRTLAAKFLLVTTAQTHCPQDFKPSAIKRYFFLPGSTEHWIKHFLADRFRLSGHVSDTRVLEMIETGRSAR